jgi:GAF domain-containing protein
VNSVLQSIVNSAVAVTGAAAGWVLVLEGERLKVAAAAGAGDLVGSDVPASEGTAGFTVASGQPMAVAARAEDTRFSEGVIGLLGRRPSSVLCVPCASGDAVVGVLELVDKTGGGNFTFDDVELASLLAGIAAAAVEAGGGDARVTSPAELGGELERLALSDPAEYGRVARLVEAILARG